jgi:hypothetical protein
MRVRLLVIALLVNVGLVVTCDGLARWVGLVGFGFTLLGLLASASTPDLRRWVVYRRHRCRAAALRGSLVARLTYGIWDALAHLLREGEPTA